MPGWFEPVGPHEQHAGPVGCRQRRNVGAAAAHAPLLNDIPTTKVVNPRPTAVQLLASCIGVVTGQASAELGC